MLAPLSWLKEHIDINDDISLLESKLNLTGTAVESIREIKPEYSGVITGKILSIVPHPDADKLVLCDVDVGGKNLSIVCGAKNMKSGDVVAVALDGAVLKGGFKIKRSKIRGVESFGMLCSESELGLAESSEGILLLDKKTPLGVELQKVINGSGDHIFEFEIMPNRPDSLCVIGIAREIKAINASVKKIARPEPKIVEATKSTSSEISVVVEAPELCPRYSARIIKGIKVAPSPKWLQDRLDKVGIRSINNVVDITNYIMWETGQPLHAFDLNKLKGPKIIVRMAKKGESIKCLDDVTRSLTKEVLVIADAKRPVAIAGVMGGSETEVDESTVDILIESANFKRQNIMSISKMLGMFTESSRRFERGVDPNGTDHAANRCAELVSQLAGGSILKGMIDIYPNPIKPLTLKLRVQRITDVLGISIKATQMINILKSLDFEIIRSTGKELEGNLVLEVRVPTFRVDIEREIDLIEEVARFYGYENVTSTLPASRKRAGKLTEKQQFHEIVHSSLVAFGLSQVSNLSFASDTSNINEMLESYIFHDLIRRHSNFSVQELKSMVATRDAIASQGSVEIKNPLSSEFSYLRQSLIPGLLRNLLFNKNRGISNIHLYEIGRSYVLSSTEQMPDEHELLSFVLTGDWADKTWSTDKAKGIDLFDGKGLFEELVNDLGISKFKFGRLESGLFSPARCIEITVSGGRRVGVIGELHPEIAELIGISTRVVVGEIDLDILRSVYKKRSSFKQISKYPAIKFDLAFLVDTSVTHEDIVSLLKKFGGKDLSSAELFDVYIDPSLPKGKKSLAYALEFQSNEKTLTDEDIKKQTAVLVKNISGAIGAQLRV